MTLVSEGCLPFVGSERLNLINIGTRAFIKNRETFAGKECGYRICQESLRYLMPLMGRKRIEVPLPVFRWVVAQPKFEHHEAPAKELTTRLDEEGQGCLVIMLEGSCEGVTCQNFAKSTTLMVSKEETLRLRLLYQ